LTSDGKEKSGTDRINTGKIDSRRVYTGRVVSLDVDTVRFPNGTVGELEMVRHPGASAIVPILQTPEGPRVLLIRQYRYAAEGFVYEIPAGRLDKDESPDECAHRELREETGYTTKRMIPLTMIFTTPGFTDEKIYVFAATDLMPGHAALEEDEILDVCPMAMEDVFDMIRTGEIKDGKTICALFYAQAFLKEQ
jgi:ADP-ribose pyrophosphatase